MPRAYRFSLFVLNPHDGEGFTVQTNTNFVSFTKAELLHIIQMDVHDVPSQKTKLKSHTHQKCLKAASLLLSFTHFRQN